jgi:hypothetical protein
VFFSHFIREFGSQFSGIIQIIFHKDEVNEWETSTFLLPLLLLLLDDVVRSLCALFG